MFNWSVAWGLLGIGVSGLVIFTFVDMLASGKLNKAEAFSIAFGTVLFVIVLAGSFTAVFKKE